jgi:hypothetical protein
MTADLRKLQFVCYNEVLVVELTSIKVLAFSYEQ